MASGNNRYRNLKICLQVRLSFQESSLFTEFTNQSNRLYCHIGMTNDRPYQESVIIPTLSTMGETRADSRFAPSQWETALLCNDVSHWLGASLESVLETTINQIAMKTIFLSQNLKYFSFFFFLGYLILFFVSARQADRIFKLIRSWYAVICKYYRYYSRGCKHTIQD